MQQKGVKDEFKRRFFLNLYLFFDIIAGLISSATTSADTIAKSLPVGLTAKLKWSYFKIRFAISVKTYIIF